MKGIVDGACRALLSVALSSKPNGKKEPVTAWVDTAFNGSLTVPRHVISDLGLKISSTTEATLADGTAVELETFLCYLEWFGETYRIQVVASDGEYPLLGTTLLANHLLRIDYKNRTLLLDE